MWLERVSPHLNALWRGEWKAGHVEPARSLYDHELVCVTRGRVSMTVGGGEHLLEAGDFLIVPPDVVHVSRAVGGRVSRACVHFDWEPRTGRPPGICTYYPRKPRPHQVLATPDFVPPLARVGRFDTQGVVPGLLHTLFHRWRTSEPHARALCRGIFLELLTRLFWPALPGRTRPRNRELQLAHAAKELLEAQDGARAEQEGIPRLLTSLGFSYAHLCRLFRRTFGVTPVGFLNARRLEKAKELLADPGTSVTEVASAAGFRDVGYFVRKFREQNGVSPGKFRQDL